MLPWSCRRLPFHSALKSSVIPQHRICERTVLAKAGHRDFTVGPEKKMPPSSTPQTCQPTIRANTEPGEAGMDANNSARALAALALSMATVQRLVFAKTLSRQDAVDLADGALVIIENIAHEFPDDVQRGARAILAETQTAFSRLPSL